MGRSNTTGLPFVVGRPDAGNFTYHRKLPDGIGPLVAGRIDMPWMSNARDLEGRPTITISLKTGDLKTARERWADLHPQTSSKRSKIALLQFDTDHLTSQGSRVVATIIAKALSTRSLAASKLAGSGFVGGGNGSTQK
jgi:hypothetical protein